MDQQQSVHIKQSEQDQNAEVACKWLQSNSLKLIFTTKIHKDWDHLEEVLDPNRNLSFGHVCNHESKSRYIQTCAVQQMENHKLIFVSVSIQVGVPKCDSNR